MQGEEDMPNTNTSAIAASQPVDSALSPNYWARMGKELIDKDYQRLHTVEDVCSILGISAGHFREVFRTAYGVNPKLYLARVKVEKAMELLKDESVMVCDVAMRVGIPQRNVFKKTFKKIVGTTPSQYRKSSSSGEKDSRKRPAKRAH